MRRRPVVATARTKRARTTDEAVGKTRQAGSDAQSGLALPVVSLLPAPCHRSRGKTLRGKQIFHRKTIHGTKKDADRYLTAARREMDLGTFVEPTAMSVNEYLNRWLRDAARPRVSQRTADGYAGLLERYIRQSLGHKRLDKLQPLDIQTVYGAMQARGLSARIVRHAHSALHNALKQAVKWGLLSRNPSDLVELPKVPHKERRVLSPDEAADFLEAAAVMPHGLIFEFALLTGMRPEEYLALQWSDVDFERSTAQVRRALVRHKKSWSFEGPKTARSRRTVYLPAPLLKKLAAHKRRKKRRPKTSLRMSRSPTDQTTRSPCRTKRNSRPAMRKTGRALN